jgi:hypothetical protein
MTAPQTTAVEVHTALLERLRERRPGVSDRELVESMARIALGREALHPIQNRSALPEDEAIALGVEAVHGARQLPSNETSVKAILERAGGKRMSPEEFDEHFGDLPTDGEG